MKRPTVGREAERLARGVGRVGVGEPQAVVVAVDVLVDGDLDAGAVGEYLLTAGAFPPDGVQGAHVAAAGSEAGERDRCGVAVVVEVSGERSAAAAPAGEVICVAPEAGRQASGREAGSCGIAAVGGAGEGHSVDREAIGAAEIGRRGVVPRRGNARVAVAGPLGGGQAVGAGRGDGDLVDQDGRIAGGHVLEGQGVGGRPGGELVSAVVVGIRSAYLRIVVRDVLQDGPAHGDPQPGLGAVSVVVAVRDPVGLPGDQPRDRLAEGVVLVLDEGHVDAVGHGAVVGKRTAAGRVESDAADPGPTRDRAIAADVTGPNGEGIRFKARVVHHHCPRRRAPRDHRGHHQTNQELLAGHDSDSSKMRTVRYFFPGPALVARGPPHSFARPTAHPARSSSTATAESTGRNPRTWLP